PPRSDGVHARVQINDDAPRGLTVNGYHLRATSCRSSSRYQTTPVRLDDLSRLGEILLGVAVRIAHIDFPDEVDRWVGLSVDLFKRESAQRGACQHSQSYADSGVRLHEPVPPVGQRERHQVERERS